MAEWRYGTLIPRSCGGLRFATRKAKGSQASISLKILSIKDVSQQDGTIVNGYLAADLGEGKIARLGNMMAASLADATQPQTITCWWVRSISRLFGYLAWALCVVAMTLGDYTRVINQYSLLVELGAGSWALAM